MNTSTENDILFDDLTVLIKLNGKSSLAIVSSSNDCDCGSYTCTTTLDESDTYQIPPSISQTSR